MCTLDRSLVTCVLDDTLSARQLVDVAPRGDQLSHARYLTGLTRVCVNQLSSASLPRNRGKTSPGDQFLLFLVNSAPYILLPRASNMYVYIIIDKLYFRFSYIKTVYHNTFICWYRYATDWNSTNCCKHVSLYFVDIFFFVLYVGLLLRIVEGYSLPNVLKPDTRVI